MRLISLRLVITALTTLFAAAATAPARAADPCTFLTTAQVTAAMGTPVNDGTPGPKNCMWHATKPTATSTSPSVTAPPLLHSNRRPNPPATWCPQQA